MIRFSQGSKNALEDFALDLTPMLDVMFILLLFMILSFGISFDILKVDIPQTTEDIAVANDKENLILQISADSITVSDNSFTDLSELKTYLQGVNSSQEIIIATDKGVDFQRFLSVLEILQALGIKTADIVVEGQ